MTNKQKIHSVWAISTAIIAITLVATPAYELNLAKNNKANASVLQNSSPITFTKNEREAQILSKQIVALVYNEPNLTRGLVLGDQTPTPLNQEEIADISTPTVVRVFNKIDGTITFPEFDIDLLNFALIPNNRIYTESVKTLMTGTGFFVDGKGHILTNAHVVDEEAILEEFISQALLYYGSVIQDQLANLSPAEQEAFQQKMISQYGENPIAAANEFAYDILEAIYSYLEQESEIEADQQLTILDPTSVGATIKTEEDLEKLADEGFEASIVDWKPDYRTTHRDVALLKIEQSPTPFLSLNTNDKPSTGQQIYVIGFPSNAEVSASDLFSRTMTQGSINSIKNLEATEVYQTDAKISPGSSGSPMLNGKGEVIGIISFLNNGVVGDNFGYAVPIEHATEMMASNNVQAGDNPYLATFAEGLRLAQDNLCRKANEQFALSQSLNQNFSNPSLQKYIDNCNETIAAGNSEDGRVYEATEAIKAVPIYAWGGGLAFVVISLGAAFFLRRMKKSPETLPQSPAIPAT